MTFNQLEQGDQVIVLTLAQNALKDKSILKKMCIHRDYEKELKVNVEKIIDKLSSL